jgi:hypothetical protein
VRTATAIFSTTAKLAIGVTLAVLLGTAGTSAAPSAEVAKRCVHYAYILYPWKRPGAAPQSGDRQAYVNDCFSKNGDVPTPKEPAKK